MARTRARPPGRSGSLRTPLRHVAVIEAGDTGGLYELISTGRWRLSADQAEFCLAKLDAGRTSPYLDRFRFARRLQERVRPVRPLRAGELHLIEMDDELIAYAAQTTDSLTGMQVSQDWIDSTVRPQVAFETGFATDTYQASWMYGGALALVLLVLSAGVLLLLRGRVARGKSQPAPHRVRQRRVARAEDADHAP